MKLRELLPEDLAACVAILRAAYNPPPWNDQWTEETGKKYLAEDVVWGLGMFPHHSLSGTI